MSGAAEIAARIGAALAAAEAGAAAPGGTAAPPKRRKAGSGPFRANPESGWIERAVEAEAADGTRSASWRPVCSALAVLAATRDAEGEGWGLLVRVTDRDGAAHDWAMPSALLAGNGEALRAELLGRGLRLAPGREAPTWLREYLAGAEPEGRARVVSRIGWHGRRFVLPDATLGPDDGEAVILETAERSERTFQCAGTAEGWRATVAAPAAGNSRLVHAISVAFAPPLLALAGDDGALFHLRGASSSGKSTALAVAGSVWGGGSLRGYVRSWRSTANGLEGAAMAHCDALLVLDELAEIDGREAGAAIYMLANGRGKARAGRDGAARRAPEWRVLGLSAGEIGLADKVAEAGGRVAAGQAARLIDLRADAGAGLGLFDRLPAGVPDAGSFAQSLKQAAREHHGHAARAFVAAVAADPDAVRGWIGAARGAFVRAHVPAGADGQVRRVADRFALVAAAGELATALGLTGWPEGEAAAAAARCFDDWIADRGGIGAGEVAEALRRLRAFVAAHERARFENWRGESGRAIIVGRAGFVRREEMPDGTAGPPDYYIFPATLTGEILAGLDGKALARDLAKAGALVPDRNGNASAVHRVPALGGAPQRLYHVPARWLAADADG